MFRENEIADDPLAVARGIGTGLVLGALMWWPILVIPATCTPASTHG